jgi:nicotinate-nucleotide adenylyltransferase
MPGVGLMGGTFNPIHLGHLYVAEEARVRLELDRVEFIPNQVPPHRQDLQEMAPARDRYEMVRMAVSGNPRFTCSSIELDRPEVSHTFDTVSALRQAHPGRAFTFLAGADSLLGDWYRLDDLLGLLDSFVVLARPGSTRQELEARLDGLGLSNRGKVRWLEIPGLQISATDIRARIRAGQAFRYLVSEPVYNHISEKGLYLPLGSPASEPALSPAAGIQPAGCNNALPRRA